MTKPARPWFRFYSEALGDRKIRRIAKALEMERVVVVGAWVGLLCLASDSPDRGALLLTDELAFTIDDMAEEIGCAPKVMKQLLGGFQKFQMLEQENGVWYIFNWGNRQFESDYSVERVRRWREKRLQETLQERHGNPSETEAETEVDTKTETEKKSSPPKSASKPNLAEQTEEQEPFSDSDSDLWELARKELEVLVKPAASFKKWIEPVTVGPHPGDTSQTNAGLTLLVPSEEVRDWLDNRLRPTIGKTLEGLARHPVEFEVRVEGGE